MSIAGRMRGMLMCAVFASAALPADVNAQDVTDVPSTLSAPELSPFSIPSAGFAASLAAAAEQLLTSPTSPVSESKRGVLVPLYVSFAALQLLDAHSTLRAIDAGGSEQNPLLRGMADRPAALVALKSGVAASTILLADKLRHRSRTGAVITMVALNSLYATVVAHNYSVR